jgi:hypothetical protein
MDSAYALRRRHSSTAIPAPIRINPSGNHRHDGVQKPGAAGPAGTGVVLDSSGGGTDVGVPGTTGSRVRVGVTDGKSSVATDAGGEAGSSVAGEADAPGPGLAVATGGDGVASVTDAFTDGSASAVAVSEGWAGGSVGPGVRPPPPGGVTAGPGLVGVGMVWFRCPACTAASTSGPQASNRTRSTPSKAKSNTRPSAARLFTALLPPGTRTRRRGRCADRSPR